MFFSRGALWRPSGLSAIHSPAWALSQFSNVLSFPNYTLLEAQSYKKGVLAAALICGCEIVCVLSVKMSNPLLLNFLPSSKDHEVC